MTVPNAQENTTSVDQKPNDKELNFRALEAKYQRQLEQERAARLEAEKKAQELSQRTVSNDDEDDSEPYVDHKKLKKEQAKFGQQLKQETQTDIQKAVRQAQEQAKQEAWLENNPDFEEVLGHAEKLAQRSPQLAKSILAMPDNFERQKLVYQNIKEFGLHKPEMKQASIQEKVDANRRSPYYQPSGVGSAPYSNSGDFSAAGQKNAYEKMKQLQQQMRL